MSYRTLLVHADLSRHAPERIRLAAQLSRTHDAHLVGIAATGVSRAIFPHGYHAAAGGLEASYFGPLHDNALRALAQFNDIASAAGIPHESRLVWDLASEALARQGRFCDLIVVNQDDLDEGGAGTSGRIPEYVAFTSARPVLVVPCAPIKPEPARNVLVAWNGSKEASAAIQAALPLLHSAAHVSVVSFRAPQDADLQDPQCQADLVAFLARHGVSAGILALDRQIECGHALLAMVEQEGYDLIVMGCYGHSQFRELFVGGVTRTVLDSATVPVLMAR